MLHIVSTSPALTTALDACLAHIAPGDALILIGDAVTAAADGTVRAAALTRLAGDLAGDLTGGRAIHVLAPDAKARGVRAVAAGIDSLDDAGFVALAARHGPTMSWA